MDYIIDKITNGTKVLTVEMPSLESATLTVWVKVGSRFETKEISGISHFLEHMTFKGGEKYPDAISVSKALDGLGASYNASTSHDWTNFWIKVRVDLIERAFEILSDMLLKANLNQADIDREKGVILEEISMQKDSPSDWVGQLFSESVFGSHQLGWDIAGNVKSVKSIQKDDFLRYRKLYYHTDNIIISVAGGVKEKEVLELSNKYFGSLTKGKIGNYVNFISTQSNPRVNLLYKKSEQAHLIFGFLGKSRHWELKYPEIILSIILGGSMSSRLFTEVREKRGLAYAVHTSADHFEDTGVFATYAGIDLNKVDEAIKIIKDEHFSIANGKRPITKEELLRTKDYIKGKMALSLEDTAVVNSFFGLRVMFDEKIETPEEVFKKIDTVTLSDLETVAREIFVQSKMNLAIIGPFKDESEFLNIV